VCEPTQACGFVCDPGYTVCGAACCPTTGVQYYGNYTPLTGTGSYTASQLCARPVSVTGTGTLLSAGIITQTAGVDVVMALYTDAAGAPFTLVATSNQATLNGGRLEIPTTTMPAIAPGAYWITVDFSGAATVFEDPTLTVTSYCASWPFGTSMPSTFPTTTSYLGRIANYYISVQ